MKKYIGYLLLALFFTSVFSHSQSRIDNYFNDCNPVFFCNESFHIQWSLKKGEYYKQEYIRSKETLEQFSKMISIEVLINDVRLNDVYESKIQEIIKRKKTDPIANYQLLKNEAKGAYLLDFLLYQDGIIEWNAYKYVSYKDKKNKEGVLLFAYTQRFFEGGEFNIDSFSKFIKEDRQEMINKIINFDVSDIRLNE